MRDLKIGLYERNSKGRYYYKSETYINTLKRISEKYQHNKPILNIEMSIKYSDDKSISSVCKENELDVVVIQSIDRLGREIDKMLDTMIEITKHSKIYILEEDREINSIKTDYR